MRIKRTKGIWLILEKEEIGDRSHRLVIALCANENANKEDKYAPDYG